MQILRGASGRLEIKINAFIGVNFVVEMILLYRSPGQTANPPSWHGSDDTTGQQTDCTKYTPCETHPSGTYGTVQFLL